MDNNSSNKNNSNKPNNKVNMPKFNLNWMYMIIALMLHRSQLNLLPHELKTKLFCSQKNLLINFGYEYEIGRAHV